MRLYLDVCCFNRPFDDQAQTRIRLETESKLVLQDLVRAGKHALVWSYIMDFEVANNPFEERIRHILEWRTLAAEVIHESGEVLEVAQRLVADGASAYDALHVGCAVAGKCDVFVSTDDRLLRKVERTRLLEALTPGPALAFVEKWYEN
ncbi:PIN domain protein [Thauera sp. JM12B12]|uniref:PIN domain protein n=1 Tax=Thauera sp. JM12B12 TaxID=3142262 RepID=UPI0031F3E2F9